jgi:type 1 glutamine amidotransferase
MNSKLALILPLALAAAVVPMAVGQKGGSGKNADKIEPALPKKAFAKPKQKRKLLVFSVTNGFRHGSIASGKTAMTLLGEKTGAFEAVVSDDLANFETDKINQFDAILFLNTTGDPFFDKKIDKAEAQAKSERLQKNLQNFVKGGKGFAGFHSATDTLKPRGDKVPEYSKMINGAFDGHPWGGGTPVSIAVEKGQEKHPIVAHLNGKNMDFKEEIYQLRDPYDSKAVQMLLRLDLERSEKKNLKRADRDYGVAWVRKWGEGRVFYCSLGHNDAMYWHPDVLKVYLGGLQYALGDFDVPTK